MKKAIAVRAAIIGSMAVVAAAALFAVLFIGINGIGKISVRFLFTAPKGFAVNEGGIFPAIAATLYLGIIAGITGLMGALPVSFSVCFFVKNKQMCGFIRFLLHTLAAIPSIILGLFGYTVFVRYAGLGKSLLAGGLTLGIMIFPFLEQRIEKAITEIDEMLILSAYGMGLSKRYIIMHIVLPLIKGDIIRAAALYISFAMGATAPIILTAAVLIAPVPTRLTDPVMALPYHLYLLVSEGIDMESAYATAFVLLALVLCINAAAAYLKVRSHTGRSNSRFQQKRKENDDMPYRS